MNTKKNNSEYKKNSYYPESSILSSVIENTNASIWAVDKNYCLIFGNSTYHSNCKLTIGRKINIGELALPASSSPEEKNEWKKYYDRALSGEIFSIERESKLSNNKVWTEFHFRPIFEQSNTPDGVTIVTHDITDRKKTENELINFKELFSLFMKHSPIYTFIKEVSPTKSIVLQASDNYSEMIGISGQEMIGKTMEELFPFEFAAKITADDWKVVKENKILQLDEDLNNRHYTTIKFPIVKEDKRLLAGYTIDITERKKAEKKQEQLALMLNAAPNAIMIHDFSGKMLYANQKTFDLHGYKKNEFMSLSLQEIDTPESAKHISERMKILVEKGEAKFEVEHFKKDGTSFPLEVHILLTKWGDNDAIISVATDITNRKQNEIALIESENKFKTIAENSPDAIFLINHEGNYMYANKSASKLLGYTIEEILNLNIRDVGKQDIFGERFQELLKKGELYTEMQLRKKDDSSISVDMNAVILPNGLIYGSCRDLTERKNVELALKKHETFLIETQKIARIGTYTLDVNSGIWESSETLDDIFGIDANFNKTIENWVSIIHTDWQKIMVDYFNDEVLGKKVNFNKEYKIIRPKDNKERWVHGIGRLDFNESGDPAKLIGTIRDITESKHIQEELFKAKVKAEKNEKRYKEMYNNLPIGIFRSTLDGNVLSVNPSFLRIYGFDTLEEAQNINASDYYIDKNERDFIIKELKKNNVVKGYISRERKRDGTEIWVETNYSAVKDENKKITHIDGILEDITDRIEAENKVKEYEKRLQMSLKATHASVFEYNFKTREVFCTPEIFQHIGYEEENTPKNVKEFEKIIYPDDLPMLQEAAQNYIEGKTNNFYVEYRIKDVKGDWFWLDGKGNIIEREPDGSPVKLVGISRDITDKKEVELELLKAKEKAEESDRLKSAFLANMSHEIRTPMNGILGFANLLKEPLLSGEEQRKYIDIIERSGLRMLNTINDIIDISKIEANQVEISLSDFHIPEQIENIISFFHPEANKKGIELLSEIRLSKSNEHIRSDKDKLYAIIANLVKNAIKYCDKGYVKIGCYKKDNTLELYVKDTGKGIPESRIEAIFDRFTQADIEDREVKEGSGLGLAIAKSYVDLLKGKIWVESEKGTGSTFYFKIPFHPADNS